MDVAVCFSGGKDSALAAVLLEPVADVTLVTGTFGVTDEYDHARAAADALDLPWERVDLDRSVAEAAVERMVTDGYPNEGIQQVHEHCLAVVADTGSWDAVADGTRRDDRTPWIDRPTAQSLEDRHGVEYLAPLAGIGRGAVDALVERTLTVETGPSEALERGDYEGELRTLLAAEEGRETVMDVFPEHTQSLVTGRVDAR